jgi:regulatory protein
MKQPSGANAQKETVRVMNRLMRAGFSSRAIYKVLREWDVEVSESDLEESLPEEA